MDLRSSREDFPLLRGEEPPVYLDNACVTMRPDSVIGAVERYYTQTPACAGRSVHRLSTAVSREMARARHSLATFFNAESPSEIVFTRNATHSLTQVAYGLELEAGDVVLTTDREHNSNLVPWLQLERDRGIDHRVIPSHADNTFDVEVFEEMCSQAGDRLAVVSLNHVGNLDGVSLPMKEITSIAKDQGALVCLDGAQSAPHMRIDVADLGIDFFACSIHKMLGPSGMGVLWGKEEALGKLQTIMPGGSTVSEVTYTGMSYLDPPARFEGGLGNYAGIFGTTAAIEYLSRFEVDEIHQHEVALNRIITDGVRDLPGIEIIGPEDAALRGGITSMLSEQVDVHDLAMLLDETASCMLRSGMHCVHSWFAAKGISSGSLRSSVYFYNTEEEVRTFVDSFSDIVNTLCAAG